MRLGFRPTAVLGFLAAALGLALMRAWPEQPTQAQLWAALAVAGLGFTLADAPLYATVINDVDRSRRAAAAALLQVMQTTGMMVGMALLATQGLAAFNRRAAAVFREQGLEGDPVRYTQVIHQTFDETFVFAIVAMLAAAALALTLQPGRARRFRMGSGIEED
jgi:MFS family permease